MADTAPTSRDELRAELARLRVLAELSGTTLAQAIGVGQATVSRIENGVTLPSLRHVRDWLDAVQASDGDRRRLTALAEQVHGGVRGWANILDRDGHAQREARQRELSSRSIRNFQPTVIPGLLQTPEYARAILSIGRSRDVEAAVAGRVERQTLLRDPAAPALSFLIGEGALRWPIGGADVLAEQRDRLMSLSRLAVVDLAVLPASATEAAPWSNFILWEPDDGPPYVAMEVAHGAVEVFKPDEVALYEALWSRLWDAALHGDEATDLIRGA